MVAREPISAGISHAAVKPAARRTLADDVHEQLTALIMDHAIPPNTKVSIDELARQLEVSPTPVREALARFEEAGLVRKESLRGYFTTPLLNRKQVDELFEFRRHLEPWAAARAAELVDDEGAGRLLAELHTVHSVPPGTDYESYKALTAHDTRFHELIFSLADNQVMLAAFQRTNCHLHLFRLFYGTALASPAVSEHSRVADAISAGDPDRARGAMAAHIDLSYNRLKERAQ
ncbi:GntR family transcriptional regulator [Jiangella alba]|uniref:DNA-binding transcriptional regulator, GntR family n=1 Tax=Jiangella alba TaxID=561176 RepID=A0A1H5JA53_9ACTN|nr:GntR family transcriptional regulator [Jiangella alba]SEE49415.1 DNA-binding transcriptional regulator, GntR family [Jiangella alba]